MSFKNERGKSYDFVVDLLFFCKSPILKTKMVILPSYFSHAFSDDQNLQIKRRIDIAVKFFDAEADLKDRFFT